MEVYVIMGKCRNQSEVKNYGEDADQNQIQVVAHHGSVEHTISKLDLFFE